MDEERETGNICRTSCIGSTHIPSKDCVTLGDQNTIDHINSSSMCARILPQLTAPTALSVSFVNNLVNPLM